MESNFIVSARKYRPQTFDSVVGQKSTTTTLKNAIKTQQLAHAYLFCGPRGVGKTTCARIFAKTINCQSLTENTEACNECQSCSAFNTGRSITIHELDAASNNSVDDIRKLIDQVRIPPQIGRYSVYIIDEVHMLSTQAFNAFLKTLEEPPEHAIFILATTEKHKILPTILSRCQIFDFNRIQVTDIADHLTHIAKNEGITVEPEALTVIAQKADGGLRDALSFFDQIASFADKQITYDKVINSLNVLDYEYYFKLTECFLTGDYVTSLNIFDDILNKGFDAHNFIVGLSTHFRDILVSKDTATLELLEVSHSIKERYIEQSKKSPVQFLLKALNVVSKADVEHKFSKNKRLHAELMLLQLAQISGALQKQFVSEEQPKIAQNIQAKTVEPIQQVEQKTEQTEEKTLKTTEKNQPKAKIVEEKPKQTTKLPSISSLINGNSNTKKSADNYEKAEEKTVTYSGSKQATLEQIEPVWLEFGKQFEEKQARLFVIFSEYNIKLDGQTILLEVSNVDQKEKIEKITHLAIDFLNKKLDSNLKLDIKIAEAPIKPKNPYSGSEKYNYLREKKPEIEKLRIQFNLFVD